MNAKDKLRFEVFNLEEGNGYGLPAGQYELKMLSDLISANIAICQKSVLSSSEAAAYLGVSLSTLYKMTHRQQIPCSKPLGKLLYFSRVELEQWMMRNRLATAEELQDKAQTYCSISKKKGGTK